VDSYNRTPRLLIAEALVMTLLARASTAILPFPWLLRTFVPVSGADLAAHEIIPHVCHAVSRIANFPFLWAVCLPQALAAHWMLARRSIPTQIRFGVRSASGTVSAHAWLMCQGRHILGHRAGLGYEPIFEFPPQGAI
jgi:hypothetical protein